MARLVLSQFPVCSYKPIYLFIQFYPDSGFRFKVWGLGFLATVCEDLDRDRDIAIVAHVPLY